MADAPAAPRPRTLFEKIWDRHVIRRFDDGACLVYIDRHFVFEVTSPQAFEALREAGRPVRRPQATFAVADHNIPTTRGRSDLSGEEDGRAQLKLLRENTRAAGISYFDMRDPRQGIVHVIGPEQGLTQPGLTIACGDSHTPTHGAFGAYAVGVGTSEVEHILATQTLLQRAPRTMRICAEGRLPLGVTSKDLILSIIGKIGMAGATGCAVEFAGATIRGLSMEGRMTVASMAIEAGARAGLIAPDATTAAYLAGRPFSPAGADWDRARAYWDTLFSDSDAAFDVEVAVRAEDVEPMVTWGTSPDDVVAVTGRVPDPAAVADPGKAEGMRRALDYMRLAPGQRMSDIRLDKVFIGSCTNGRIEDLRGVAEVVRGRRVAAHVTALVVPGSMQVKAQAEQEGVADILTAAGFEWREAGCSMCIGLNADRLNPGERCASTSNRNFEGRQGAGGLTHLVSPPMAAAAAINGHFVDVRKLAG
ncbi:3-isopropylmalate dehydratase large subunit [Aquabacter spiritensis]|uniref:3-isopropylmalate dehydratase large subunit n=1 Tax=Aquabacter spiritensis TaxID=933073 RepID=A0A4R3LWT5_9HYPH|nr:3-isopropylmalate dehydratase large subunit [Aquabacter spiritensis]TCT04229.1 3-isopropylmalate dehydratase large subunit [Aquabacter spiritensis]